MVYDCFSFFNEIDVLKVRLNVLDSVVDKFILVESPLTHTGLMKPLYFEENAELFRRFRNKIIHVVADTPVLDAKKFTSEQMSWARENWQRNAILRGLVDAKDDDVVIISDIDEIPDPKVLARHNKWNGITALGQIYCNFFFNFVDAVRPIWYGSRVLTMKTLRTSEKWRSVRPHYALIDEVNNNMSPTRVRYADPDRRIKNGGWHFSYLGSATKALEKIRSVGVEHKVRYGYTKATVENLIANGLDVTGGGGRFFAVPLDSRFPSYVLSHTEELGAYILKPDADYYRRTKWEQKKCFVRGWIRRNGARLIPRPFKQFLYDRVYRKLVKEPIVI